MFLQDNILLSVPCTSLPFGMPVNISERDPDSTPRVFGKVGKVHRQQGEIEMHRISWVAFRVLILNPSLSACLVSQIC